MRLMFDALWFGLVAGTSTRTWDGASVPGRFAAGSSLVQALYRLGFEVTNIAVFGRRT